MYQHYNTSCLQLASALTSSGFKIASYEKIDQKVMFYFPASHEISLFVEDYFLWKIKVDPLAYANAQKHLKNYLFNSNKK